MSNHMRMTDSYRANLRERYASEFLELLDNYLSGNEMPDGKLSFVRNIPEVKKEAVVYFSALAWSKMVAVINTFDKEVAWHGLVKKLETDADKKEYLVYDIVVYPQEVTGATVNTDQEEYEKWLDTFNDEDFDAIRMQGHSHVNMGVSPSSVDIGHKEQIIKQLSDDMFYIFMIWNKKFQHHITIYDFGDNVSYEDKDVEVKLYDSDGSLDEFIANAKKLVKDRVYLPAKTAAKSDTKPAPEAKKPEKSHKVDTDKKSNESKTNLKSRTPYSSFCSSNFYNGYSYDYEDDDDPCSPFGYRDSYYRY